MRFNLKLTEYNNTATIAIYDELVGMDDDYERPPPSKQDTTEIREPFTNTIVTEMTDKVDEFTKEQYVLMKSVQRSKRNILKLIRSMDLTVAYFVTLTFDKAKVDRNNYSECCAKTRNWLQNLRKRTGAENMSFLCVPELHPKHMDAWHMHLIISNPGDFPITDSGHKTIKGQTIYNVDLWRYGFSTAIRIDEDPLTSIKLARYVTKYFTKESTMIAHNRHRFFASQNIPRPKEQTWCVRSNEERDRIIASILNEKYQEVSESRYDGYVGIRYIEAICVK